MTGVGRRTVQKYVPGCQHLGAEQGSEPTVSPFSRQTSMESSFWALYLNSHRPSGLSVLTVPENTALMASGDGELVVGFCLGSGGNLGVYPLCLSPPPSPCFPLMPHPHILEPGGFNLKSFWGSMGAAQCASCYRPSLKGIC